MRLASCLAVVLCYGVVAPAQAQHQPVLVELFTSQGCVACPPAEVLMQRLADREDVVALALHVDYWDYIGWTDSFGRAEHSARQWGYMRNQGRGSVYTPQMIIGGIADVKGSATDKVLATIQDHLSTRAVDADIALSLSGEIGGNVTINAVAQNGLSYAADVQLVRYINAAEVEITGGENAGHTAQYRNIVTTWDTLGTWDGAHPFSRTIAATGDQAVVVIVQEQGLGPVLAVARKR